MSELEKWWVWVKDRNQPKKNSNKKGKRLCRLMCSCDRLMALRYSAGVGAVMLVR